MKPDGGGSYLGREAFRQPAGVQGILPAEETDEQQEKPEEQGPVGLRDIQRNEEHGDERGDHQRPAPSDAFRHPAPEAAGEEREDVAPEHRNRHLRRVQPSSFVR